MINLSQTFHRTFLGDQVDVDSLHGVVEGFDWPTRREAREWLQMHLDGLNTWRRYRQRELQAKALQDVAELEYNYSMPGAERPTDRFNRVGMDLARQLTLSTIWTRLFQDLRDIETKYDTKRDLALTQHEALMAHLDSLEVS